MKLLYILFIPVLLFFSACSSKEVFKPAHIDGSWKNYGNSKFTIKNISSDAALIEDQKVMMKGKTLDSKIESGYSLIGASQEWIISSNIDGNLTLQSSLDSKKIERFTLKRTIATASVNGDLLAVLFANNEMALYSISDKSLLLKEQGDAPIVVNSKIVKPNFKEDLVVFATLDGKVVIINAKTKKKLRTVIVSSEEHFNNIIYLDFVDNKIISATGHKILSLAQKEVRLTYDIRSALADGVDIFVATKQGEIISLTPELQQNAKVKFPFAHFLGMIVSGDKLYVLEKEGFLIELSKDLSKSLIHKVSLEEGYVFIDGKIFYVDDEYISVE